MSKAFSARFLIVGSAPTGSPNEHDVYGEVIDVSLDGYSVADVIPGFKFFDENGLNGTHTRYEVTSIVDTGITSYLGASANSIHLVAQYDDQGVAPVGGPTAGSGAICASSPNVELMEVPSFTAKGISEALAQRIRNIESRIVIDPLLDQALNPTNPPSNLASNIIINPSILGIDSTSVYDALIEHQIDIEFLQLGTENDEFSIGDGYDISNKILFANNGDTYLPALRYNVVSNVWEFSNDGIAFAPISTGGGIITDHGALTGLGDDDHIQYLRVDGTRELTGGLLPDTTNSYDIGSLAVQFKDGFFTGTLLSGLIKTGNELATSRVLHLSTNQIEAKGTLSNIDIDITSKGTGVINLNSTVGAVCNTKLTSPQVSTPILSNSGNLAINTGGQVNCNTPIKATSFLGPINTNVTAAKLNISGTTIIAQGTDTNVNVNITSKGTGNINLTSGQNVNITGVLDVSSWIRGGDGTTGLPTLSFSSDTDTGLERLSANNLALVTNGENRLIVDNLGNLSVGASGLATSATDGFLNISSVAGTPSGVATTFVDQIPMVFDRTNNKLYSYNGASWTAIGETEVTIEKEKITSTLSQTVFSFSFSDAFIDDSNIQVFSNRLLMYEGAGEDYQITDSNEITFNTGRAVNEVVMVHKLNVTTP